MTVSNIEKNRTREKAILLSLDKLDYLTTSQLQRLHDLKGHRNACRVLKNMSEHLSYFTDSERMYYLNKYGREVIGSDKIRKKLNKTTILHYVMRNDYYIHTRPKQWNVEQSVTVGNTTVISDAILKKQTMNEERFYFLEVDNEQRMYKNEEKIRKYEQIKATNGFQKQYGYFPVLIWVTKHRERKRVLMKKCKDLSREILLWDEIK